MRCVDHPFSRSDHLALLVLPERGYLHHVTASRISECLSDAAGQQSGILDGKGRAYGALSFSLFQNRDLYAGQLE